VEENFFVVLGHDGVEQVVEQSELQRFCLASQEKEVEALALGNVGIDDAEGPSRDQLVVKGVRGWSRMIT